MYSSLLTIYITTFFLCLATYLIFPLIIAVLANIFKIQFKRTDIAPSVSIIISAYNEQRNIEQKILNTLALDYPENKLEILMGNDGSSDGTAEIIKRYAHKNVRLFDYKCNRGKTSVQNDLVNGASGEILVFTDAASFLSPNAVKKLIRNFADDRIGCVAGKMLFVSKGENITTQSQGIYWQYETKIKEKESQLGRLIGVDGPLYAVRKNCYVPLQAHIISDLMTPLLVLEQGKMVILEPESIVEEEPTQKGAQEFKTRRRITLRGLTGIFAHPQVINPLKHPWLSLHIFMHKILRWFVGPLVLVNILALGGLLYYGSKLGIFLAPLYCTFFLLAACGWYYDKSGKKLRILTIPYYFCLVNAAATFGIFDFFMRRRATTWETVRNSSPENT